MKIHNLVVTQNKLRLPEQIFGMVNHAKSGNLFNLESLIAYDNNKISLIRLEQTEDGQIYIADGLHRIYAIYKSGRAILDKSEYVLHKVTYAWYQELNPQAGWVTPHNPLKYVRLSDLSKFKKQAFDIWNTSKNIQLLKFFINHNFDQYAIRRKFKYVKEI